MYYIVQMSAIVLIPDPVSVRLDTRQRTFSVRIYHNRCLLCTTSVQMQILSDKYRSSLQKNLISRLDLHLVYLSQTAECFLRCIPAVCIISVYTAHINCSSHTKTSL